MTTIQKRLLEKIRVIHIEMDEVGVVERNGHIAYLLEPGWHPALNPWNERLVGHISLLPRRTDGSIETNSKEGLPFTTKMNLLFSFDPRQAGPERRVQMLMMLMQRDGDRRLQRFVQREAEYALRNHLVDLTTEQLLAGNVCCYLERSVRQHFASNLRDSGVSLPSPSAVMVAAPEPNPAMLHTHLYIYGKERIAELYERHPQVQQSLVWQEAFQNESSVQIRAYVPVTTGQLDRPFSNNQRASLHQSVGQPPTNGRNGVPQKDV